MSQTKDVGISAVLDHHKKKKDKTGRVRNLEEACSMLFLRNTNDPFLDRIVKNNGTFMIIVKDWPKVLILTRHPNTFQNRNCMNRS